ncbi:alpha/beta fold hydrolase [Nocardioides sp. KIGAM211]|uniref:Alpha/beta fold hydrolase n=1 Tax=Nocardioides luti TaxID=2761101 RepID=A0A7X0VBR6_9ACTN|nr:alpha/beta fold hydrolase [Nocardioides luti]MBB6628242.1 alpha/beta fold hydrolase [Nocardioides luti]
MDTAPAPATDRGHAAGRARSRWLRRGWRRRVLVTVAVAGVAALVLNLLDTQVRTPVGAAGVGRGTFPVVEISGLGSDGTGFADLTAALGDEGVTVLDFDPGAAGTQPLVFPRDAITAGTGVADLATSYVAPQVRAALTRAGLDPDTQQVDVVAHSMGGLTARYLVEEAGWADRVDDLVMVATPNHGSDVIDWETRGNGPFRTLGRDMAPGSALLDGLGYAEPAGEVYTAIGGDPWVFRWYRHGSHGFDDQVPSESPFLDGAANNTWPDLHGRLLDDAEVVDLITATLRAS